MPNKIMSILCFCILAFLFASCTTSPYEYMDNWVIRQNAVPRYFADFDVIYIYPTMFQNPNHIHMNWSKPPLAQDVCDYIKTITVDVFTNKTRIFAPFIHQVEYTSFMAWLPLLPLDDYDDTSLEDGINDTLAALNYYFKHFHAKKHPFIIIGHGQGAMDAYEAMKRCSKIKPENGFIAAYLIGIPKLTQQQIIDDFSNRGIMPAEGEFDTGVICTWNPILPSESQSIFSSPGSFVINPLNWKTDSTPAASKENPLSILYYHDDPDILKRLKPTKHFCGATINPINGTLTLNLKPDFTPQPSDRLEEGAFRSNRYGLFIGNIVTNCRKRVSQYKHKLHWNITEQKDR